MMTMVKNKNNNKKKQTAETASTIADTIGIIEWYRYCTYGVDKYLIMKRYVTHFCSGMNTL